jgi:hypothetical protein
MFSEKIRSNLDKIAFLVYIKLFAGEPYPKGFPGERNTVQAILEI